MTDDLRYVHALIHVAEENVEVCATDTTVGHINAHLIWPLRVGMTCTDFDGFVAVIGCLLHVC